MRIWSWQLIPYLSDLQLRGQLRELVAIKRDWETKGTTNHLLINRVMEYPKADLYRYFCEYEAEYFERYGKTLDGYSSEFGKFANWSVDTKNNTIFDGWHNKEYLRVCMANLYEKHHFGIGKSRITDEEWQRLLYGYKRITGEEYVI
jgi:uncharacterized protein (TIGR02328 family)